ncbi:MAG: cobalamin biosynthesis protein CbiG [Hyphomonadaceae bacterium]|nr:MAG: molybdopterin-guanine dinucleotide biosynthesis protein A [Caulobacteraceae bacterium]MBT9444873.1 cobalamin biosynthesis protein CbiG [Hyphomonadaceae bacterium]TPW03474.1 MAG: molybdopterin-guanine dinucleotide biosynthesis protein A [Alphaproteobacteria bacterium]
MSRLFDAYVMVDWSAASRPTTGSDSIWIGVLKKNVRFQLAFEAHNPSTRAEALALIEKTLADLARRNDRVLLGFDFPLGFPKGTAAALKLKGAPWSALIDFVASEMRDKPDNTNNRFQIGAKMNRLMTGEAFPFWGCPAKDAQTMLAVKRPRDHAAEDLPEYRLAEQAIKGPSPIWKLYYQGSVGGQALTGLPVVKKLKSKLGDGLKLWPFETGWKPLTPDDLEGVAVVAAEIYPTLHAGKPGAGEVKDAAQVRAAAEHFAALDEKGRLAAAFGPKKDQDSLVETVTQEEGWILGV